MKVQYIILFFVFHISIGLAQNPGDVVRYKKIGNNQGGLGNVLGNSYYFGASLENIGDINGDGITDMAAGIHGKSPHGGLYILFMDTNGTVQSKTLLTQNTNGISGLIAGGNFGCSVSSIGDINNDGINDIVVGALGVDDGGNNTGAIYIICLNSSGVAISQQKISKTTGHNNGGGIPLQSGSHFGCDIAYLGDLNNDGNPEIAVGSSWDNESGQNNGAFWILSINSNKKAISYNKIRTGITNFTPTIDNNDYFGQSVEGIGDFDGDGIPDIASGALYDDDGITNAGAVYIIHLNSNSTVKNYTKISNYLFSGNPISGTFGTAITMIPDISGDGYNDLAVGAPRYAGDNGAVYILKITANDSITGYKVITNPDIPNPSTSRLGRGICCLKDYNSDGYPEIVAEAPFENGDKGAIYIMTIKNSLSVNISPSNLLCNNDSNAIAIATGSGGNPPYTYLWSNGSTNDTIIDLNTGTYSVTMTNSIGATVTSTTTIGEPNPISFNTTANSSICDGASMTIAANAFGGTGSKTIIWSHGLNNGYANTISPTTTTTYQVYATDANGCISDTNDIIITVIPRPTTSFSGLNTAYCSSDNSVNLIGSPSGGTFAGSGISGSTFDPANANTGNVDIVYSYTDANGCFGKDTNSTVVNAIPNITFSGINAAYCTNDNGFNLDTKASPSGGSFTINGSNQTAFYPAVLGSGTFKIKYHITSSNGCTNTDSTNTYINPTPSATYTGLASAYCQNDASASLIGTPAGGSFSGNGVSGNSFAPNNANIGYNAVTYSYTNTHGCTDTSIYTTTVNAITDLDISTTDTIFCNSDAIINIAATPLGGTLSGNGIDNNARTFDPTVANIGNNIITYTYTNPYGCISAEDYLLVVNTPANLSITGLNTNYCVNNNAIAISGNPTGGTFYGDGINGNYFNPNTAGIGSHTVSYKYDNGCEDTIHQNVVINTLPDARFTGLASNYCVNNAPANLAGLPVGGSFSGSGISSNTFDPSSAGIGNYIIRYTSAADANGCIDTTEQSVIVNGLPIISFTGLTANACVNDNAINLSATPSGGVFSGNYTSSGSFYPNNAGSGNHTIYYDYTDANSCSNTDSFTFIIHDLPAISFTIDSSCANTFFVNLNATPSGGNYIGNYVSGNTFRPSQAGAGSHQVIYSYTDALSCSNTDTQNIIVNAIPNIVFNITNTDFCIDASSINLSASPGGGTFSGSGVGGITFSPTVAGVGSHDIIYAVTDANLCSNSDTNTLIVHAPPSISLSNYSANSCIDNINDTISAIPYGGSFVGAGMNDSIFSPYTAGIGIHKIKYFYSDAFGCGNLDSIDITVFDNPSINIISGLKTKNCKSDTAYSLNYSPAGGVYNINYVINNHFFPTLSPAGHIGFTYTYTDANGCSNSIWDSTYVYNNPTVEAGNDSMIPCNSTGINIGEGSFTNTTYLWTPYAGLSSPFVSNPVANPWQSTVYTVTKTDLFTTCSAMDSIIITIPEPASVVISGDTIICYGDTMHLTASGADTFYWDNGYMGTNFNAVLPITQYISVYGIDSNNCYGADSVIAIVGLIPQPDLGADTAIFDNQVITLDAGNFAAYQWTYGQNTQTIDITASSLSPGNYYYAVQVESFEGCIGNDTIIISITTGIESSNAIANIKLYPNPTNGIVNIEWGEKAVISIISIFDTYGKHIRDIKVNNTSLGTKIDLSTLARGIYYLRLKGDQDYGVVTVLVE